MLSLGTAGATLIGAQFSEQTAASGTLCNLTESEEALGYGIHGLFPVKSCMLECKWNKFFIDTFPQKVLAAPDQEENTCKCNYAPRYWEGATSKKFWFQFRINSVHSCTLESCQDVFFTWGNGFLKKWHFPGDSERMDVTKRLQSQENYNMECAQGIPEGIVLPSPGSKITELRLKIAQTDDPEEKARLQALLDELLGDKVVEVFEYDLEGEWGEEHHADSHHGPDLHSFYLKPCKSNLGNEVTELKEILEQCGPWEKGTTMKEGKLRYSYHIDKEWGPEMVAFHANEDVQALQKEVDKDGWKLLSFRLKPCMTPSGDREVTDLDKVLSEDHCGMPMLGESLLPVKVSASKKYDHDAPEDEYDTELIKFPCPEWGK